MTQNDIRQLCIPGQFWQHPDVSTALARRNPDGSRDIGGLLRLINSRTGTSQSKIGAAVGLEQGYISKVIHGQHIVVSIDVLERLANGLGMPDAARILLGLAPRPDFGAASLDRFAAPAVHAALLKAHPASGRDTSAGEPNLGELEARILEALSVQPGRVNPSLVLVSGFAGSGKTEFGRFLSSLTSWSVLDKDALTRPLVESLLLSKQADPNDRHTTVYREHVRPLEYRCLMNTAFNNLSNGISSVVTAPFLAEIADTTWLSRIADRCRADDIDLATIWVDADAESMYSYLQARDAARDTWKLSHWDDYLETVDLELRPCTPHFVVDNRQNVAVTLAEQAKRLTSFVHHER